MQPLLDQVGGASVPRLPDSPLPGRWLFEQPLPLVAFLVAGAILAWFILSRTGRNRAAAIGAGGLTLAAVAVFILASAVHTEREQLIAKTRLLVDDTLKVNLQGVAPLLDESFTVRPWNINRETTLARMARDLGGQYAVKEHQINQARAAIDGPNVARTQVHVRVTAADGSNAPLGSWWLLHWQKDRHDGQWRVVELEAQQIDFVQDVRSIAP